MNVYLPSSELLLNGIPLINFHNSYGVFIINSFKLVLNRGVEIFVSHFVLWYALMAFLFFFQRYTAPVKIRLKFKWVAFTVHCKMFLCCTADRSLICVIISNLPSISSVCFFKIMYYEFWKKILNWILIDQYV